jgi:hypothetical protein
MSVSWRIRLSELSCVSSRHRYYRGRRIGSRIDQVKAQVQDEQLEDNICLKLAIYCVHGYVKICLKRVSPIVEYRGAIRKTSPSKLNQERWSNLRIPRPSLSSSSGMLKIKVWYWESFFPAGLMVLVVRPGYRIGSYTIKRGSRVSNLIILFGDSSNLCILSTIFLGSYLYFLHVRF